MFARIAAAVCISLAGAAAVAAPVAGPVVPLDGHDWRLAPDAKNVGVAEKWCEAPRPEAKQATVPGLIQDVFPGYAGVAWFWRDVVDSGESARRRPLSAAILGSRLSGGRLGQRHARRPSRRAQAKFTLDVTAAVKPGETNRIAVRVLSLFNQPIEGFVRSQTPHGALHLDQFRRDHRFRGDCRRAAGSHGRSFRSRRPENRQDSRRGRGPQRIEQRRAGVHRLRGGPGDQRRGGLCSPSCDQELKPGDNTVQHRDAACQPAAVAAQRSVSLPHDGARYGGGLEIGGRDVHAIRISRFPLRERLFPAQRPPRVLAQRAHRRRRPRHAFACPTIPISCGATCSISRRWDSTASASYRPCRRAINWKCATRSA